ncbi:hypothetical protein F5Y10DRAFT_237173 [Nemania abortiva]|nr:hypothetical protein F5Y10DRAFT_237173 [Nemania abortiva]
MRILKEGLHGSTTDGHSLRGFLLSLVVCCLLVGQLDGHGRSALAVVFSLPHSLLRVPAAAVVEDRDESVNPSPTRNKTTPKTGMINDFHLGARGPPERLDPRICCIVIIISRFALGRTQW